MSRLTLIVLGLLLLPALNGSFAAAQSEIERPWSEIPSVVGHEIALALPDGTYIQGKALAVQADALEMDVKKTSDRRLHPKGKTTIPRSSISVIEIRIKRQKRPKILGNAVGVALGFGGLALGIGAEMALRKSKPDDITPPVIGILAGIAGGAIAGRYVARDLVYQRKTELIKIIPEPPESSLDPTQTGSEAPGF